MANKFAIATGNWNDTAIWNDGVVPTTGDDVWANSFTITLNQDVDVSSLRSNTSPLILPYNPIPLMTSNTTPSGTTSAGSTSAGSSWFVFDQDPTTFWTSSGGLGTTAWVSYQLTSGVVAKRYYILRPTTTTNRPTGWLFQGSNDGSTWDTLETVTGNATTGAYTSGVLANTTSYTYYRILVNTVAAGTSAQLFTFEISTSIGSVYGNNSGGSFIVNTSRTITCNSITAGSSTTLQIQSTNSTININSNILPSTTTNSINTVNISSIYTGNTVNVNGNLTSSLTARYPLNTSAPDTNLTIIGNSTSGIVVNVSATNTNVTVTNPTFNPNLYSSVIHGSSGTITINGNLIPTGTVDTITKSGPSNVIINGDVYGALGSTGNALSSTVNGGSITINGNVYGGNTYAISLVSSTTVIVNGNVSAGLTPGIVNTVLTGLPVRVSGNIINSIYTSAIYAYNIQLIGTGQSWELKDELGNSKPLYSPGTDLGNPAITDVRQGTTYASGSLTGTLKVPPVNAVSVGVPTDNTVGTAVIDINDMGALLASYVI